MRYKLKKVMNYSIALFGILLITRQWFKGFDDFTTFLGLFSAGIAIALKDLILNIVAWLFIIIRKPLEVGDRIEIDDARGDVIDLRIFQLTLLEVGKWVDGEQSTGRIIHIPNGSIFNKNLINYNKGFEYIWNEVNITLTFESNWKKAKGILNKIANDHSVHLNKEAEKKVKEASKKYMIIYSNLTPIVYTKVVDIGVMLTIRHLCSPRDRRNVTQNIWENILIEFDKHKDIEFAYVTYRIYDNLKEGKVNNETKK